MSIAPSPRSRSRIRWLPSSWRYRLVGLKVVAMVEGSWWRAVSRWIRQQIRAEAVVLYYPDLPKTGSVAYKLCALLAYRPVNDPAVEVDYRVFYSYATKSSVEDSEAFAGGRVMNDRCLDISKRKVHEVFLHVFGYHLSVDPTTYCGPMVEKADENSVKRTRLVHGPLDPPAVREGYVYERVVDTTTVDGELEDLRVPMYGGSIPAMYATHRSTDDLFREEPTRIRLERPETCFTSDERARLSQFVEAMGMDYGELDVLRDSKDGRIYVVDANSTSHGPDEGLAPDDLRRYFWSLANAYRTLLERGRA